MIPRERSVRLRVPKLRPSPAKLPEPAARFPAPFREFQVNGIFRVVGRASTISGLAEMAMRCGGHPVNKRRERGPNPQTRNEMPWRLHPGRARLRRSRNFASQRGSLFHRWHYARIQGAGHATRTPNAINRYSPTNRVNPITQTAHPRAAATKMPRLPQFPIQHAGQAQGRPQNVPPTRSEMKPASPHSRPLGTSPPTSPKMEISRMEASSYLHRLYQTCFNINPNGPNLR